MDFTVISNQSLADVWRSKGQKPAGGVGQTACGPETLQSRREKQVNMREIPGSHDMTPAHVYATRGLCNALDFFFFKEYSFYSID